ncbi:hypothetical protein HYPSUDRAFT_39836 [Hypholoma sublateritium FD-334 SS-4]|uniref:F-box domain-containing protein n=1 Tax=Hypholoma sublateritium (strain FD-334 SS-4) TaxID=945553 RepID=A0A0D2MIZ9_HYPSF|nr:hypothetical protein HYPSUDRAFT_39836 [Hypholoma sublateritium FD-334 SS-4]
MTTIPVDILEHIVDILASDDDQGSIKACSLMCHSLLHFCRRHIFKTIIVGTHSSDDKQPASLIPLFCRLICNAPHIADYVRILTMGIHDDSARLCSKYPEFAYVLGQFNHIQSLTISDPMHSGAQQGLSWDCIQPLFQKAILHLVQFDTLTSLCLGSIRLPVTMMKLSPSLRRLELDNVQPLTFEVEDTAATSNSKPLCLQEFKVDSGSSVVVNTILSVRRSEGLHAFDFNSLRSFQASWNSQDGIDASRNVLMRATHLVTFELTGDVMALTTMYIY